MPDTCLPKRLSYGELAEGNANRVDKRGTFRLPQSIAEKL